MSGLFELHRCELSDPETQATLHAIAPDVAFHLAWFAEPDRYLHAVEENAKCLSMSSNLIGSLQDAGCGRLVLAGTCLEGLQQVPDNPYVSAKRALHELAMRSEGATMSTICAHIFYLFGPYEDSRRVIPQVIQKLLAGRAMDVTKGEQLRDYLHVEDVAAALCRLGEADASGSADISSGHPVTLRQVFEIIGERLGRADLLNVGARPYAEDEIFEAVGYPTSLEALGWKAAFGIEEGLARTIEWWKANDPLKGSR